MAFSFGGLPDDVLVGLRRRWRLIEFAPDGATVEDRLMAVFICMASLLFAFHLSSPSEPELFALSEGATSLLMFWT